jgi:hypothetical protein
LWRQTRDGVRAVIARTSRLPSVKSEDPDERRQAFWIRTQKSNYSCRSSALCKGLMRDPAIRTEWVQFCRDTAVEDHVGAWRRIRRCVDVFILVNDRSPAPDVDKPIDSPENENVLATWISDQRTNHECMAECMGDPAIRSEWSQFIAPHDRRAEIKRVVQQGDEEEWVDTICPAAARAGKLDVLRWARTVKCPWTEATCLAATEGGHLHVLQWARVNGCPWDRSACFDVATTADVRDWISRN